MRRPKAGLISTEFEILSAALELLRKGTDEFYGFLIATKVREYSEAQRLIAHGTLYKALARLEGLGFLSSRWEDSEVALAAKRPRRRLYALTPEGHRAIAAHAGSTPAAPALKLAHRPATELGGRIGS